MIKLTVEDRGVHASLAALPAALRRAAISAVTKTMRMARTAADREIRAQYTVKLADLRDAVTFRPATTARPVARIVASAKRKERQGRIPLIDFAARVGVRGVTVQVKRSQPRQRLRHAFVATMRSGHRGIFERVRGRLNPAIRVRRGAKKQELPIVELYGPSVPTLYGLKPVFAVIRETIKANYERLLRHEVAFFQGRKG